MQPLRRELLSLSIPYFEAFVAQRSDDPALRADLAKAYTSLGKVTAVNGRNDQSRKLLKTAIGQFEPLLRADPSNRELQIGLGRAYLYLAEQSQRENDVKGGFDEVNRAAAVLARAVSAPPADPAARRMLGRCYDLAASFRVDEDPTEARLLFEKALTVLNEVVRGLSVPDRGLVAARWVLRQPRVPARPLHPRRPGRGRSTHRPIDRNSEKTPRRLARQSTVPERTRESLMVRGQICLSKGALTDGAKAFEEGLLVIESVVAKNPDINESLHLLSMILSYVAEIRTEQGRTAIARTLFEKAIAIEQELLRRGGTMSQSAVNLIDCQSMLARLERESGRAGAAKKALGSPRPEILAKLAASPDPSILGIELKVFFETRLSQFPIGERHGPADWSPPGGLAETRRLTAEAFQGCHFPQPGRLGISGPRPDAQPPGRMETRLRTLKPRPPCSRRAATVAAESSPPGPQVPNRNRARHGPELWRKLYPGTGCGRASPLPRRETRGRRPSLPVRPGLCLRSPVQTRSGRTRPSHGRPRRTSQSRRCRIR